jgi:hypothetical protein
MNAPACFSIIVHHGDALKFATVSACYARLLADRPHEIIGIRDAPSRAEAYRRGMQQAKGDILVFSHDDVLILDTGFAEKISARLKTHDLLGFVGTDRLITATWFGAGQPHLYGVVARPQGTHFNLEVFGVPANTPVVSEIQALEGFCMIARRETANAIGFDGARPYDLDFSFSAFRAGYKLGVCCDIPVITASAGHFDAASLHDAECFLEKHFSHLGNVPPEQIRMQPECRAIRLQDHHALLRAWQPDILARATIAMVLRTAILRTARA